MSSAPAISIGMPAVSAPAAVTAARTSRLEGVDAARAIAAFAVVCIHTGPLFPMTLSRGPFASVGDIVNQLVRFAVPFFFAASGFFFARASTRTEPVPLFFKQAKRLGFLFAVWSAIYLFVPETADAWRSGFFAAISSTLHVKLAAARAHPLRFILEGTSIHLWFFPSLIISLGIVAIFATAKRQTLLLPAALLLYVAGQLVGPYAALAPHIHHFDAGLVRDLFAPPAFVAIGYAAATFKPSLRLGWIVIAVGFVVHFSEAILLKKFTGRAIWQNDFLLGTLLLAWGSIVIATASGSGPLVQRLAALGPLALGIYVLHPMFRPIFFLLGDRIAMPVTYSLVMPVLLFILCAVLTRLLRSLALGARLVS